MCLENCITRWMRPRLARRFPHATLSAKPPRGAHGNEIWRHHLPRFQRRSRRLLTISEVSKQPVTFLWHDSPDLQGCDAIIVPGGFAYGDYLRTGAIAKFSPVMESVRKFAADGGLVLGIKFADG